MIDMKKQGCRGAHCMFRTAVLFSILVLMLSGCLSGRRTAPVLLHEQLPADYVSEVALPEAKATYAYGQYRLLAAAGRWDDALQALRRAVALDPQSRYLQMGLAKAYMHTGQQEQAVDVLQQMLGSSPDDSAGHELLGDLLLYQKKYSQAVTEYNKAAAADKPPSAELRLKLAQALARQGDFAVAIAIVQALVAETPGDFASRLTLARFYRDAEQIPQAVDEYRVLLDMKPGQMPLIIELGMVLEQGERYAEAIALYRSAVDQDPRSIMLRDRLARILVIKERYDEALEALVALDELHPDQPQILGRIGLLQLEMDLWPDAELSFRKVIRLQPEHTRSYYYLGLALSGRGLWQEALEALGKVDSGDDVYLETITQRTYLLQKYDEPQRAIELLEETLDEGLRDPVLYYYLALALDSLGQTTAAAQRLSEGLEHHPGNISLRYQYGVILEKRGEQDDAKRQMETILETAPNHADALNYLAYLKAERGVDLLQALDLAQRALAVKETAYILDTLGWVYFKLGRYDEGRESLERALSLQPGDVVILEHLAELYRALTLWPLAAEMYRQILAIDPTAEGIGEKLDALPNGEI